MSAVDVSVPTAHQCVVGDGGMIPPNFGACRRRPEPASFLKNLRCILLTEDPRIISWSENGRITIADPVLLSSEILHRYFRHSQFSSFQRQLNYFGYYKVSGKGKMHRCVYTNDALPNDADGTPGVTAPPYPVDVLLRLKRKSSQDNKPGGMMSTVPAPSEAVKRLAEEKTTKPARRRSFGGVKEGMRAAATLQRHLSEPRIAAQHPTGGNPDLSSADDVFDWAEPIDSHADLDDAGDDVSPNDYVALLSDETDLPAAAEQQHQFFSPIPPHDHHRDLSLPGQPVCDSRAWRSTFPAYSDHPHPALASGTPSWESAKRRDVDQLAVSPWPTKAMRGVPRAQMPLERLPDATHLHKFDRPLDVPAANYAPFHVGGITYDGRGRDPFQLQVDFKVKQDDYVLRPRSAEVTFSADQGYARRLSMSSEPQTPTHDPPTLTFALGASSTGGGLK